MSLAARCRVPERSDQQLYSVRDLAKTLNVSRRTLLYYEELGIVQPKRDDETGYRWYTPDDIFRLMSCILLKNIGIAPRDLGAHLDSEPFTHERFAEYRAEIETRIAYYQAQRECMDALGELVDSVGTIEERHIEPYYISYDNAETGYHDFPDDEGLVSLLQNMPIGGLGNHYVDDIFAKNTSCRWGRTVAVRFAHLVLPGQPPKNFEVLGGCRCVCSITFSDDIYVHKGTNAVEIDRLRDYFATHGLRPAGSAFAPYSLPSDQGFHVLLCVPAEPIA